MNRTPLRLFAAVYRTGQHLLPAHRQARVLALAAVALSVTGLLTWAILAAGAAAMALAVHHFTPARINEPGADPYPACLICARHQSKETYS